MQDVHSDLTLELGRVLMTRAASELLEQEGAPDWRALLNRHANHDFGDVPVEDRRANYEALLTGARVISSYGRGTEHHYWVITEAASSFCPDCVLWSGASDPACLVCGGSGTLESEQRWSTTILLPDDY